jgi:ABC-type uncharacterized transport system permease subunit
MLRPAVSKIFTDVSEVLTSPILNVIALFILAVKA